MLTRCLGLSRPHATGLRRRAYLRDHGIQELWDATRREVPEHTRALGAGGMFRTPPLLRVDLGRKSPQLLGTRGPVDWELVITVHRTHDEE